jgi:DNA gyrase subunit A
MLKKAIKSTVVEAFRPTDIPSGCGLNDKGYKLSEKQVIEILQMRLQRLTGLEQEKIINDFQEVIEQIADLLDILANPERISNLMRGDFEKINNDYQDQRKSLIQENAEELQTEDLITPQDVVVTFSNTGYVKSQPISEYTSQRRGGRGKLAASTKENDWIERILIANTHNTLLGFTSRGRVYWMRVWEVPQGSRSSRGRPIVNFWPLEEGEKVTTVLPVKSFDENRYVFMATNLGTVKKTSLSKFARPMKRGIIAAVLDEGDTLIGATITDGNQDIMLFSTAGKAVRYAESNVRPMGRGSRGVRGMFLENKHKVVSMLAVPNNDSQTSPESIEQTVFIATQNGFGKRTPLKEFTRYSRGTKGMICIKTSPRNGMVVGACLVNATDDLMLIANNGVLVRFRVDEVREMGRSTQGVRLISLDNGSLLTGFQSFSEPEIDKTNDSELEEIVDEPKD